MAKAKRMRLPNGFGQITELKGRNLRKPFRAMVTVGKNDVGKPICKLLKPEAYFRTYNEAYAALMEHHKNPYEIDRSVTMLDLYEKWSKVYYETLGDSATKTYKGAWAYCNTIYDMKVADVRIRHLKGAINDGSRVIKGATSYATPHIKIRMKSIFNLMFDYAVEYELAEKNYAREFDLPKEVAKEAEENRKEHIAFNEEEVNLLWNNLDFPYVDILLIQCYSGWRPQELGLIKMEDVDIENGYFTGGMKTEAGSRRIVPIHSKVYPLVKARYDASLAVGSKYLFNCPEERQPRLNYDKYWEKFNNILIRFNLNSEHKPHDGRNTFITLAKKYKVDEYAIKYMVGHVISDITEKVYTDRSREWLKEEIEKIKGNVGVV